MLSAAAREIGAGRLDQRVEPQSNDEFGSLVEAFNAMATELATSRRRVDRGTVDLERKHVEVEARRRYVETILERITTGVVSVDAAGAITTINSAAARLLGLQRQIVGQAAVAVFDRTDLQPLRALLAGSGISKARAGCAGNRVGARRSGAAPRGGRDRAGRRDRRARRRRAGARRRYAADSRAESRGMARGGAPARARNQEPADADSVVGRTPAPTFLGRAAAGEGARGRVHGHHRRAKSSRSRGWWTSSRSLRGCRRLARCRPTSRSS